MNETLQHKPNQNAVIVLGMHRSGSSLLSGILHLLGANLGSTLIPPAEDNPKGFWENQLIVDFHDKLLLKLHRQWDAVLPLPKLWWESAEFSSEVLEIEKLLDSEFEGDKIWGLKDPRICLLLPFWVSMLERKKIHAHFILIHRHPEEIHQSLFNRNDFYKSKSHLLYLHHYLSAEFWTRDLPRTIITYDSLLEDWREFARSLKENTRYSWPEHTDQLEKEIDAFVDIGIRHNFFHDLPIENELDEATHSVHQALVSLSKKPTVEATEKLNKVRTQVLGSESLLNAWMVELDLKHLEKTEFAKAKQELLNQQLSQQKEINLLSRFKEDYEEKLSERDARILKDAKDHKAQLDEIDSHRNALKNEIISITRRAEEQQDEVILLSALKEKFEEELTTKNTEILDAAKKYKVQLDEIDAHRNEQKNEISSITLRADEQQKEIFVITSELESLQFESENIAAELSVLQTESEKLLEIRRDLLKETEALRDYQVLQSNNLEVSEKNLDRYKLENS
ncbi:MAG: hypothetical protein ACI9FB_000750, partial [Candidatus Azotimanducaceae bacterium]